MSGVKLSRFLLLYGSQTGQAEAISEEIEQLSSESGFKAERHCLSLTDKRFSIEDETCIVFVVSTTGDGEPPEKAHKFFRRLKKTTLKNDHLKTLHYSILGLGDSNYNNFCNCARLLDKRLQELGASRFYDCGFADDAIGLEVVVEPWIESLWPALKKELNSSASDRNKIEIAQIGDVKMKENIDDVVKGVSNLEIDRETNSEVILGSEVANGIQNGEKAVNGSLTESNESLSSLHLNLPAFSATLLTLQFDSSLIVEERPKTRHFLASTDTCEVPILSAFVMTSKDAVKKTLEISLDISGKEFKYEPGDSFGVVSQNDFKEVDRILERLGLLSQKNTPCGFSMKTTDSLKSKELPKNIPSVTTLYDLFVNHCDIRSVPRKKFLRILSENTSDSNQKRRLEELSSRQGADDYVRFVLNSGISLLDLLIAFPSCSPPVECILENLPVLQPRFYSVSNSPLVDANILKFVFNVVEISESDGRCYSRGGVCTKWIDNITNSVQKIGIYNSDKQISELIQNITFSELCIPIFMRKTNNFHLPTDISTPMILIGPGTGIAPFMGFLEHREFQRKQTDGSCDKFGEVMLFYGCRHKDRDYLYKDRLESLRANGTLTSLFVSFSRDDESSSMRYVQHCIKENESRIFDLIHKMGAIIYVCGDAKGMAKNVYETIIQVVQSGLDCQEEEARNYVHSLQESKRYLQDIWS